MWTRTVCVVLYCLGCAWAGGFYQRATVTSMQTTECVSGHHSVMAALSGTPDNHRENCAEYVLVSPTTIFRVQARKSAPLLLPSEEIEYRPGKGALMVRRDDQGEQFEVTVVCMQMRGSRQDTCAAVDERLTTTAQTSR